MNKDGQPSEPADTAETAEDGKAACGAEGSCEPAEGRKDKEGGEDASGTEKACGSEASDGKASGSDASDSTPEKGSSPLDPLMGRIAELEDRVKRQMAEFDNFRKRTDREKDQRFSMGERNVIEKMLPVVDNFEHGLAAIPEAEKDGPLASGMELIYKQLMKQLTDLGVKPIEAVGKEFDPNFHNAVMQADSDTVESGHIVQEFQKGYLYHDSVLRHSMVSVAK